MEIWCELSTNNRIAHAFVHYCIFFLPCLFFKKLQRIVRGWNNYLETTQSNSNLATNLLFSCPKKIKKLPVKIFQRADTIMQQSLALKCFFTVINHTQIISRIIDPHKQKEPIIIIAEILLSSPTAKK